MTAQPFSVLVVCVGNVCRSPVVERLLDTRLQAGAGGRARVASAGTRATNGHPMEPDAAAELSRLGGDPSAFVARRVTPSMLEEADLVVTLTKQLRTEVLQLAPRLLRRAFTLGELAAIWATPDLLTSTERGEVMRLTVAHRVAGAAALDVADPMGRPPEIHRQVADQISKLVDHLVPVLADLG